MITLTREAWGKFAPKCPPAWTEALFGNLDLLTEHGILETELRWCHFAGTVWAETGNFKELRENLYYTTLGALRRAWPSRFGHMPDSQARAFLRNPRALANKVYNGRMGNRPGSSDGYDYRGGGYIQTTGRSAVEAYCKQLGIEAGPNTLDDPVITLQFAVLEWTDKKCNDLADQNDILKIAKSINVGSADSNVIPNGMDNRREGFARAWKLWGEYDGHSADVAKAVGAQEYTTATVLSVGTTEGVHAAAQTLMSAPTPTIAQHVAHIGPKLLEAQPKIDAVLSQSEQGLATAGRFRGVTGQLSEFGVFLMANPAWLILMVVFIAAVAFWPKRSA